MKTVALLRHGKASRDDPKLDDFDRPLTGRGVRASQLIGEELRRRKIAFSLVIASPARRVVDTLREIERGYGTAVDARLIPSMYQASSAELLAQIRALSDDLDSVLLAGHNPVLQNLATTLAAETESAHANIVSRFPTAALALIGMPAGRWRDLKPGTGRVLLFLKPRGLERESPRDVE